VGERLFTEPPSIYQIKLFIRYLAETLTGVITDQISDNTVRNRLASLKRAIRLNTNHQYSHTENEGLTSFYKKDLVRSGEVSTLARCKPVAPLPVAEDLVHFLWACDEYQMHPRARLQLAFSIILMTLQGNRPGEFIESEAWKNSNEGLIYEDITLIRWHDVTYSGYLLQLKMRNRKGYRDNAKHSYASLLPLWNID
jgi:hypothetical protein